MEEILKEFHNALASGLLLNLTIETTPNWPTAEGGVKISITVRREKDGPDAPVLCGREIGSLLGREELIPATSNLVFNYIRLLMKHANESK